MLRCLGYSVFSTFHYASLSTYAAAVPHPWRCLASFYFGWVPCQRVQEQEMATRLADHVRYLCSRWQRARHSGHGKLSPLQGCPWRKAIFLKGRYRLILHRSLALLLLSLFFPRLVSPSPVFAPRLSIPSLPISLASKLRLRYSNLLTSGSTSLVVSSFKSCSRSDSLLSSMASLL